MRRIVAFIVIVFIFAGILDTYTGRVAYDGPHSELWRQVCNDKEIDMLFLGNSHAYTSVDTKLLTEVYGIEVDTLSASSCSFKESYEAFNCLLKYTKPKYIVIEMYSVLSDSLGNQQTTGRAYMYQHLDGLSNYAIKASINVFK